MGAISVGKGSCYLPSNVRQKRAGIFLSRASVPEIGKDATIPIPAFSTSIGPIRILPEVRSPHGEASLRPAFHYLLGFAYNPRSTLPAASTKKPTNRSVNPVWTYGTLR